MQRKDIEKVLRAAKRIISHEHFVVIGSLSILGAVPEPPTDMVMSVDVDLYPRDDPGRAFDLAAELGEESLFAVEHGFYADPVSPALPTLPEGWRDRLISVDFADGIVAWFLDPNDAAVAKYARGEERDRRWAMVGLAAGVLDAAIIEARMGSANFLDQAEHDAARIALAEDVASSEKPTAGMSP